METEKDKTYEIPKEVEDFAEEIGGGWWNYRIFEEKDEWTSNKTGNKYFDIGFVVREVYYNGKGEIFAWSEDAQPIQFQNMRDLKALYKSLKIAAKKPVLRIANEKVESTGKRMKDYKDEDMSNFDMEAEYGK